MDLYIIILNRVAAHFIMQLSTAAKCIETLAADAADRNPEHIAPRRLTPGDVRGSRNQPRNQSIHYEVAYEVFKNFS